MKQPLYTANQPIGHVYFPTCGVVSLVARMAGDLVVEVATVGCEGMVGLPVFLGADTISLDAFVQVPGRALRLPAPALQAAASRDSALARLLQRYTQALLVQVAQAAACNRAHPLEARCARWLLMTRDRVDSDEFLSTQEFLAQMLGVGGPR